MISDAYASVSAMDGVRKTKQGHHASLARVLAVGRRQLATKRSHRGVVLLLPLIDSYLTGCMNTCIASFHK